MDNRLEGLLMRSTKTNVDYKEIARMLSENIDNNIDKECIYKKIYKYVFDKHLQQEECEELISTEIWTLEETNSVAKKLDYDFLKKHYTCYEFRAMMHLVYYCIHQPLKESGNSIESTTYGRIANHLLEDMNYCLIDEYFKTIM